MRAITDADVDEAELDAILSEFGATEGAVKVLDLAGFKRLLARGRLLPEHKVPDGSLTAP